MPHTLRIQNSKANLFHDSDLISEKQTRHTITLFLKLAISKVVFGGKFGVLTEIVQEGGLT